MTCPTSASAIRGKKTSPLPLNTMLPLHPRRPTPTIAVNPLERLAQLVAANDRLLGDLSSSRARVLSALSYLDRPDGNERFGLAHLERCRTRHSAILAQLRANRIEALHLLGEAPGPSSV